MGFFVCSIGLFILSIIWLAIAWKFDWDVSMVFATVASVAFFFCNIGFGYETISSAPGRFDRFVYEKPFIQGSDNPILFEKKIEWNIWLQDAQRGRRVFGWFSTQPEEVLTLTPIE